MRRLAVVGTTLVLVTLLVVGGLWWRAAQRSDFDRAVDLLPAGSLRVSFTDWEVVRDRARGNGLLARPRPADIEGFVDRAYNLDYTVLSPLADSSVVMQRLFGFSVIGADWEALGQSEQGQVAIVRMSDSVDLSGVETRLRRLGYREPATGSGGVWDGGADLIARLDLDLTPVTQAMAVRPDDRLVLLSDDPVYLEQALDVVDGEGQALSKVDGVDDLVAAAGDPSSALLLAEDFACDELAMSQASEADQAAAEAAVDRAGGVTPLAGYLFARSDAGGAGGSGGSAETVRAPSATLVLRFESEEQATRNARSRAVLARGEAIGQGGSFTDRFTLTDAATDGSLVMLRMRFKPGQSVMSDLADGPVLFATC